MQRRTSWQRWENQIDLTIRRTCYTLSYIGSKERSNATGKIYVCAGHVCFDVERLPIMLSRDVSGSLVRWMSQHKRCACRHLLQHVSGIVRHGLDS
jgi:hypothetical protein